MIPDFKTYMNESVWSDIHKKINGFQKTAEDKLHFDRDGLYDYLKSLYIFPKYIIPTTSQTPNGRESLSIPIFKKSIRVYRLYISFINYEVSRIVIEGTKEDCEEFMDQLNDKFNVHEMSSGALSITSKNGDMTCDLVMDVINTILENSSEPMLTKKEN